MNQPESLRTSGYLEIARLLRNDPAPDKRGFQWMAVLASLTLLAIWAVPVGWGLSAGPAFAQLVDTSSQHYFDGAKTIVNCELPDLIKAVPDLRGLEPAQSQKELPAILGKVRERLEASLQALPNTSSREDITEEKLNGDGYVEGKRVESFSFLILARRSGANGEDVGLEEYRTSIQGNHVEPQQADNEFCLTSGFANQWAHFYAGNRSASNFKLVGQQKLNGHTTYVVAFAQRPGWAAVIGRVVSNGLSVVILYQGIAWIDVADYQIIRMRTDLLAPRKDIGLKRQTTEIRYGEVTFPQVSSPLWLPRDVVVTTDALGRIFQNRHHYSDYRLFRSESTIKPIEPGETIPKN